MYYNNSTERRERVVEAGKKAIDERVSLQYFKSSLDFPEIQSSDPDLSKVRSVLGGVEEDFYILYVTVQPRELRTSPIKASQDRDKNSISPTRQASGRAGADQKFYVMHNLMLYKIRSTLYQEMANIEETQRHFCFLTHVSSAFLQTMVLYETIIRFSDVGDNVHCAMPKSAPQSPLRSAASATFCSTASAPLPPPHSLRSASLRSASLRSASLRSASLRSASLSSALLDCLRCSLHCLSSIRCLRSTPLPRCLRSNAFAPLSLLRSTASALIHCLRCSPHCLRSIRCLRSTPLPPCLRPDPIRRNIYTINTAAIIQTLQRSEVSKKHGEEFFCFYSYLAWDTSKGDCETYLAQISTKLPGNT
ncbi:hypothetical protein MSG28_009729 [Choristoneura fumiferana]|uniref:Uncharacterized protein n=1 Tax=Choristoneura fumiferana TaxID=7141 RepID=A0ACC0JCC9_CHOFU|nr:hypothetical protein MSG28_009729 [Choristoneura fumiferana]